MAYTVISQVDNITNLQKNFDYDEEHFDYIQWHLRKFCLEWGAGLMYTSPRESSNCKYTGLSQESEEVLTP